MNLKISRILHAGYLFECGGTQIAFDPIFENPFSRNCHAYPDVCFDHDQIRRLDLAAVFISHYHDDHCSLESLNLLNRQTPLYVYCLFEELFSLIKALGFTQVYSLQLNVPIHVGDFEIIPRRALDADVDSMFQIKAAGYNVLNVVDACIDASTLRQLSRQAPWDLILWPFQTMRETEVIAPSRATAASGALPAEWIVQLKALNPRYIVPSSCQFVQENWSWYNHAFFPISYRQFQKEVESALPGVRVVRLNPAVSIVLDNHSLEFSVSLPWIHPVGEQDVDYAYDATLTPPSTAEISRHFAPLTAPQTDSVFAYCRSGLLAKYQAMEPPESEYFEKPRYWRLSVYDHTGAVTHFHYRLNNNAIECLPENEFPLSWLTEISIAKLYAALVSGETLTSMYIRVNDMAFDPEVEAEIVNADIVDDPLIRCLFNGIFGAYQIDQLKRLGPQQAP